MLDQTCCPCCLQANNKYLSYHREAALQGGSVLAKSGRFYSADNIGLSLTAVTYSANKAMEFGEKTQNKDYYAVQGHSRSSRSVSIESPYATSY